MSRRITLADVRAGLAGQACAIKGSFDQTPVGFVIDSREAAPGSVFIALRGDKRDGNDFVADAVARGAALVISEREASGDAPALRVKDGLQALHGLARYWRRQLGTRVVGVTGSVGKTTTKEMTADVLQTRWPVLRNEANWNTEIGVPLTLLKLTDEHRWVVVEMAMRNFGQIRELARIAEPEIGVVTNVGHVHAEIVGSLDGVAVAKAELIKELPANGVAVLNAEDPRVDAMAKVSPCAVVRYGFRPSADVRVENIESHGLDGTDFVLARGGERRPVQLQAAGKHNALNAAAAAAVAIHAGFSFNEAADALAQAQPYRLRRLTGPGGSTILDDSYNASPASMRAALDLLAEVPGRHVAVLGDMRELGQYETEAHEDVGAYARDRVDVLLTLGERGKLIADAARAAGHPSAHPYLSKSDLVADLRKNLQAGDVILVKASRALTLETVVEELREDRA